MLILFDQATPVGIRKFLKEHTVQTCFERGWDRLKNGDLLEAAEDAGFSVFLTPDKSNPTSKAADWLLRATLTTNHVVNTRAENGANARFNAPVMPLYAGAAAG